MRDQRLFLELFKVIIYSIIYTCHRESRPSCTMNVVFVCKRSVEQAMAGAHIAGSPFRVMVVEGAVAANSSLLYGAGITSSLAGGAFETSTFTIRYFFLSVLFQCFPGYFQFQSFSTLMTTDEFGCCLPIGEEVKPLTYFLLMKWS